MNEYAGNQFSDELALDLACIALQTARNADVEMVVAGDEQIIEALNDMRPEFRDPTPAEACFRAMIDKAMQVSGE